MGESIENQPYCVIADVEIDREALSAALDETHGYTELTGTLFGCRIVVEVDGATAVAELTVTDAGYPELRLVEIDRE